MYKIYKYNHKHVYKNMYLIYITRKFWSVDLEIKVENVSKMRFWG